MDISKLVGGLSKSGALQGFLGGVAGGGLTSMVASKKGRKLGKSALKIGALAAVGGLAWKAYQNYSNKPSSHANSPNQTSQRFDYPPAQIPQQAFEQVVEDSNESGQMLLMRAMIAAAYADGHIDASERQRIFEQVDQLALTIEEKAALFDELRKPLTIENLVQQVPDSQTGIEVYAASLSAIDLQQPASQRFLRELSSQLCIPNDLVDHIHQQVLEQA